MSSEDEGEILSKWPPRDVVCVMNHKLFCEVAGIVIAKDDDDEDDEDDDEESHIIQLRNLSALDLHLRDGNKGKIRRIENLSLLSNLRQLNLSYNALTKIEGLSSLKLLVEINFAENSISRIEGIFHLKFLERLNLSGNVIERIPSSMSSLGNLCALRLNRNRLFELRDLEVFRNMHSMRDLRIDGNIFSAEEYNGHNSLRRKILRRVTPQLEVLNNVAITEEERLADHHQSFLSTQDLFRSINESHRNSVESESSSTVDESVEILDSHLTNAQKQISSGNSSPKNTLFLQQRLVAEKRRAELLHEEAQQARKQYQQLSSSSKKSRDDKNIRRELDLLSRLQIEKDNEVMEANAAVSQLQQEITFQEIDKSFNQWGGFNSNPSDSSDDDSSSRKVHNIYANVRETDRFTRRTDNFQDNNTEIRRAGTSEENVLHPSEQLSDDPEYHRHSSQRHEHLEDMETRLRTLSSKLIASEREKTALQNDLDSHRTKLRKAEQDCEKLRTENKDLKFELQQCKDKVEKSTSLNMGPSRISIDSNLESTAVEKEHHENMQLKTTITQLRHEVFEREREASSLNAQLSDVKAQLSQFKHEGEITTSETQTLKRTIDDLQVSLDSCQQDGSAMRARLLEMQKEKDELRKMLGSPSLRGNNSDSDNEPNETIAKIVKQLAERDLQLEQADAEVKRLNQCLEISRAECEKLLRGPNEEKELSKGNATVSVGVAPAGGFERNKNAMKMQSMNMNYGNYFDDSESSIDASTENKHNIDFPESANFRLDDVDHAHTIAGRLSNHEKSAAYSIASSILEELKSAFESSTESSNIPITPLKQACINASLRLIMSASYTLQSPSSRGNISPDGAMLPLQMFGEAKVITKLVKESQAALSLIDESKHLKLEKIQTERVLDDLRRQGKELEQDRLAKKEAIDKLTKQSGDAKRQAEKTLLDLDEVMQKLKDGRKDIKAQEHKLHIKKAEVEEAQMALKETNKLCQMEHKNIELARGRLASCQKEIANWESRLSEVRESYTLEDSKYRNARSMGSMEIRALHSEIEKLQAQVKEKYEELEEQRKQYTTAKTDQEYLLQESHHKHNRLLSDLEDSKKVYSLLKKDIHDGRASLEEFEKRKKEFQLEFIEAQEQIAFLKKKGAKEVSDSKKKVSKIEKQITISEKSLKVLKDNISASTEEKSSLMEQLEEINHRKQEAEEAFARRKYDLEEEVEALHQEINRNKRMSKSASMARDKRKDECESLVAEIRSLEKRLSDVKRSVQEGEQSLDALKSESSKLTAEHDKLRKDISNEKREEEELRQQLFTLRSSIEQDSKAIEELRRQVRAQQDEESEWKERAVRARSSYSQCQAAMEELQGEADAMRVVNERERRDLSETRAKKNMVEAELSRQEEELRYTRELIRDEDKKKSAVVVEVQRMTDESTRLQKELVDAQRRCHDARKVEEDIKRRERDAQQLKDRLKAEAENLSAIVTAEQLKMETLKEEKEHLLKESKKLQEDIRAAHKEMATISCTLDSSQAQISQLETARDHLQSEVHRLRDTTSVEISRAERVSDAHKDLEKRLREMRSDLAHEEETYQRAKARTQEEEKLFSQKQRALQLASEELSKMEASISESNEIMHMQRSNAIKEISDLDHIKQSVQNDFFALSESKSRLGRLSDSHCAPTLKSNVSNSKDALSEGVHFTKPLENIWKRGDSNAMYANNISRSIRDERDSKWPKKHDSALHGLDFEHEQNDDMPAEVNGDGGDELLAEMKKLQMRSAEVLKT